VGALTVVEHFVVQTLDVHLGGVHVFILAGLVLGSHSPDDSDKHKSTTLDAVDDGVYLQEGISRE
jgi:hypothetical protein